MSTEKKKMSTINNKLSTKKRGRPLKEETKVYSKRVPLSRYDEIKINVDKYIETFLRTRIIVDKDNNIVDNKSLNHYKNGCKVLISLFDDFFKGDFPGYIIDKLIFLLKKHDPDLIQEIKEEFIHE